MSRGGKSDVTGQIKWITTFGWLNLLLIMGFFFVKF